MKRPPTKRASHWSEQEDYSLAQCYINISEDPIKGVGQKLGSFWKSIYALFVEKHPGTERQERACMSRWGRINKGCKKFSGLMAKQERLNVSGTTKDCRVKAAVTEFEYTQGSVKKGRKAHGKVHDDEVLGVSEQVPQVDGTTKLKKQ